MIVVTGPVDLSEYANNSELGGGCRRDVAGTVAAFCCFARGGGRFLGGGVAAAAKGRRRKREFLTDLRALTKLKIRAFS